jgi:hypothetical protein
MDFEPDVIRGDVIYEKDEYVLFMGGMYIIASRC